VATGPQDLFAFLFFFDALRRAFGACGMLHCRMRP
jgi:hypothetical protein